MHGLDAGEQRVVQVDVVVERGDLRAQRGFGGVQRVVGIGRGELAEHIVDAVVHAAGAFHGDDGVGESRLGLAGSDRGDLGTLLGDGGLDGGLPVAVLVLGEVRGVEGQGAGLREGAAIGGHGSGGSILCKGGHGNASKQAGAKYERGGSGH